MILTLIALYCVRVNVAGETRQRDRRWRRRRFEKNRCQS